MYSFFKNSLNSCRTKLELLNKSSFAATTCQVPTPIPDAILDIFRTFIPHCKPSVFHLTYRKTDAERGKVIEGHSASGSIGIWIRSN